jgi:hypothetical protein
MGLPLAHPRSRGNTGGYGPRRSVPLYSAGTRVVPFPCSSCFFVKSFFKIHVEFFLYTKKIPAGSTTAPPHHRRCTDAGSGLHASFLFTVYKYSKAASVPGAPRRGHWTGRATSNPLPSRLAKTSASRPPVLGGSLCALGQEECWKPHFGPTPLSTCLGVHPPHSFSHHKVQSGRCSLLGPPEIRHKQGYRSVGGRFGSLENSRVWVQDSGFKVQGSRFRV